MHKINIICRNFLLRLRWQITSPSAQPKRENNTLKISYDRLVTNTETKTKTCGFYERCFDIISTNGIKVKFTASDLSFGKDLVPRLTNLISLGI